MATAIIVTAHGPTGSFARRVQENPDAAVRLARTLQLVMAWYATGETVMPPPVEHAARELLTEVYGGTAPTVPDAASDEAE